MLPNNTITVIGPALNGCSASHILPKLELLSFICLFHIFLLVVKAAKSLLASMFFSFLFSLAIFHTMFYSCKQW